MNNDEEKIFHSISSRNEAMINGDIDKLTNYIENDMLIPHISGGKLTKQEWLKMFTDGDSIYHSISIESLSVIFMGSKAITTYESLIEGAFFGYQSTWRMKKKEHYTRKNDYWILSCAEPPIIY